MSLAHSSHQRTVQLAVEVRLANGTKLQGTLTESTIRVTFDGGTVSLDPTKIDRLEIGPGVGNDTVTTPGLHSPLRGKVENDVFALRVDGQDRVIPRGEIKSIHATSPKATGLFRRIILPLLTLSLMEIVLGIDNIIFLAIVASHLPVHQQPKARRLGLIARSARGWVCSRLCRLFWDSQRRFTHCRTCRSSTNWNRGRYPGATSFSCWAGCS